MSDLSATNCGCGCERNERSGFGNNSCLWIIYFYSAAADAATDLAATTTAVETAVSGLSFCYSAVADLEADPTTVVAVAMDSEMAAANPSKNSGWFKPGRNFIFSSPYFCPLFVFTVFFLLFLLHISNPVHKLHFHL